MFAQFRYLDGPETGETRVVPNDFATLGRHPGSDVPFHPERALVVSVRHAAVFKQGGGFLVRDLGSSNGTFLNGTRVRGDRPLESGDILQLGPGGPRVEFLIAMALPVTARSSGPLPRPELARTEVPEAIPFPEPAAAPVPDRDSRPRLSSRWMWLLPAALVLAILAGSGLSWQSYRARQRLEAERRALIARVDGLMGRLEQASSPIPALDSVLERSRSEIGNLRQTVTREPLSPARLDTLGRSLGTQATRSETAIRAATFDADEATKASAYAVAVVVAEFPSGPVLSGSGFAIRTEGDNAWIATSRHLVIDAQNARPVNLAVIFNGTGQVFRASVAEVHDSVDLALLVTRIRGGVPVVKSIGDATEPGEAVAMLGFPFGLDSLGDWRAEGAAATASVGTVTETEPDHLEVLGYGTHGSSGAPVFNASGDVIGIVFGGTKGTVFAVPARFLKGWLLGQ